MQILVKMGHVLAKIKRRDCIVAALTAVLILIIIALCLAGYASSYSLSSDNSSRIASSVHKILELVYFLTNSLIFFVAILAFRAAVAQFEEAERTRLGAVYMQMVAEFTHESVANSRFAIARLHLDYQRRGVLKKSGRTLGEYVHDRMMKMRASRWRVTQYGEHIRIVFFLEHVSLLVRRRYVLTDDVYLLMSGAFLGAWETYGHHIEKRREEANDPTLFEHFVEVVKIFQDIPDSKNRSIAAGDTLQRSNR